MEISSCVRPAPRIFGDNRTNTVFVFIFIVSNDDILWIKKYHHLELLEGTCEAKLKKNHGKFYLMAVFRAFHGFWEFLGPKWAEHLAEPISPQTSTL